MCKEKWIGIFSVSICMTLFVTLFVAAILNQIFIWPMSAYSNAATWVIVIEYFLAFVFLGLAAATKNYYSMHTGTVPAAAVKKTARRRR